MRAPIKAHPISSESRMPSSSVTSSAKEGRLSGSLSKQSSKRSSRFEGVVQGIMGLQQKSNNSSRKRIQSSLFYLGTHLQTFIQASLSRSSAWIMIS